MLSADEIRGKVDDEGRSGTFMKLVRFRWPCRMLQGPWGVRMRGVPLSLGASESVGIYPRRVNWVCYGSRQ